MSKWLIRICAVWALLFLALLGIAVHSEADPVPRAIFYMMLGLVLLWIVLAGLLMRFFREPIRRFVLAIPLRWQIKFVLFCCLLFALEEVVTTSMTNLAPFFGVAYGEAFITASGNYLDVIFFHSLVIFIPEFIAWAWLVQRYDFSANAAFLCFGLTGVLAESISFGPQNFVNAGFWVYVYGLMIYLPVYSLPERGANPPKWWHYPFAVIFPIVVAMLYFILLNIGLSLFGVQMHPGIHF
jgi:hypothetical protein